MKAFVLICLHAMRAGLLTRLMGVFGMFAGATLVVRFLDPPGVISRFHGFRVTPKSGLSVTAL